VSAAKRVAHAAETIRARWERDIVSDPQTEAAQVLEDTGQLLDPEVASELAAFREARELAEVVAGEGALPMPAGPGSRSRSVLDRARDALGARMSKDDLRLVLENTIAYAAALEAERHSTNEALNDAVQALRLRTTQRGDVALLIERERQCNEESVAIADVEDALMLGADETGGA
jgi:hypothetical protein